MLKIENINCYYGSIHAIKDVSFEVKEGEIVTLIGANGSGKTTTLHTISGLIKAKSGEITMEGNSISKISANHILTLGISHVPEGRRVFSQMSVEENLYMGAFIRKDKQDIIEDIEKIYEKFPRLRERQSQLAGTMSGGEQQMLAIGRALMSRPKLLLMDEPSMGLAPILVDEIFSIIKEINAEGTTVLLVEQNAKKALAIAHRAYVLETGKIVMEGSGKEFLNDERVKKAYLG